MKWCGMVWNDVGDDEIKGKDKIVDEGGCRNSSLGYDFLSWNSFHAVKLT
jgi:hypothetical protein